MTCTFQKFRRELCQLITLDLIQLLDFAVSVSTENILPYLNLIEFVKRETVLKENVFF